MVDEIFDDGNQAIVGVAMLRLVMLPFGLMNYCLGCLTSVSLWRYALGTTILIVKVSLYTFIGASLITITDDNPKKDNNLIIGEVAFSIMLTVFISLNAKWYLEKKLVERAQIYDADNIS